MDTLANRILKAIRFGPLDDDVLARRLNAKSRQQVNQVARHLESHGRLCRYTGPDGKIVNSLPDARATQSFPTRPTEPFRGSANADARMTEDEVKEAVRDHLAAEGFEVEIAWGRTRGIDIEARHPDGRHFIIEAKGEAGTNGPQQVNYFLGMLGELLQRMSDESASYAIALPGNRQYRGLVDRLPGLAKARLNLLVFWVNRENRQLVVEVNF